MGYPLLRKIGTIIIPFQEVWMPYYVIDKKTVSTQRSVGLDSSVDIGTCDGLDGAGSNTGGGDIFRTRPDRPWGPSNLLYNGYRFFPGGKAAGEWR